MIAVMRIHGMVNMKSDVEETFQRMRLHRKLACVIIGDSQVEKGMLLKVREYVVYGNISPETLKKMVIARGETKDGKKINAKDADKIVQDIQKGEWKIKQFFRLHPPIGGFRKSTKKTAPKGILGESQEMDKLIERML